MKKNLFFSGVLMIVSFCAFAQSSETVETAGATLAPPQRAFKTQLPSEDKTEAYTITAMGNLTFSTSNTANGSTESYNHATRVIVPIVLSGAKPVKAQLVFYSAGEKLQYAVTNNTDGIAAYFPMQFYDDIKGKLEQALVAKKKVVLNITQKTSGFREAVLQF